jgi:hypothetical protein
MRECSGIGVVPNFRNFAKGLLYGDCDRATAFNLESFIGAPPSYKITGPATYYMDASCRFVAAPGLAPRLCGFAGYSWSPVSLLLRPDVDIDRNVSVVEFSLDKIPTHRFSLWKASEDAPLLVFNPGRKATVDSPKQLFGNWSFGGKPRSEGAVDRAPWSNGYEALGHLDGDKNGKVDGAELIGLDLWFDRDRDARVSPGELRSVRSEGIEALYYQNPQTAKVSTKDLVLEVGFDRRVGDTLVQGKSVDWYANSFFSRKEATEALSGMIAGDEAPSEARAGSNDLSMFKPHTPINPTSDVSGYWAWMTEESGSEQRPGVLALEQSEDGSLSGFVMSEALLARNAGDFRSAITIAPLHGTVSRGPDGAVSISFRVRGDDGAVLADATVRLNSDGSSLTGDTTQNFESRDPSSSVRSAQVRYGWIAGRLR